MKRIKLIATGGTISAHHDNRADFRNYVTGHYSGRELLETVPELWAVAEVEVEDLAGISSTHISADHWLQLRALVQRSLSRDGYDGVVITHGTNTLEETAYFLHLTVDTDKPIVLTGAQRPLSSLSTDAHANLLAAVRTAAADEARGKGVLVVLNDQISCAREVTKTSTYRLETFRSGDLGPLGFVDPDDRVVFLRAPTRRHTSGSEFARIEITALPEVEIVYSYAGARGDIIRFLTGTGRVRGIVVAGTGAGRCSGEEERALREAVAAGVRVVMSSRVGTGRVVPLEAYRHLDYVTADNLNPQKARILLMLGLLQRGDRDGLQRLFDCY
ncbi:MAG: asparaginase [Xanthomonadaceae bacterium]|nr:asparaginase [Xanthomonadaceae bacterium]